MKKFILKTIIIGIIPISLFFLILLTANGYSDPFYIRFTTPKQESMILGTSRAAQGIQPSVFKDYADIDIFNYAFTLAQSPFGPTYFESIKRKLNKESNKGIFIIAVDPWSISSMAENPNDVNSFREKNLCLSNTKNVNSNPNFEYLSNNLSGEYYKILLKNSLAFFDFHSYTFLHIDGWLEVDIEKPDGKMNKKIMNTLLRYRKKANEFKLSTLRVEYLLKTIEYLNEYGNVFLVRIPVHPKMMEIENSLMPDFEVVINNAITESDGYFDLTYLNNKCLYTDGNHLYKESGKLVTEEIVEWINSKNN